MKKKLKKKNMIFLFLFLFLTIFSYFLFNNIKQKNPPIAIIEEEDAIYKTNIIKNVNYKSKDNKGNEYIVDASEGQIDLTNSDIIYLTNVIALIKLKDKNDITITSKFGKYNTVNYNTIFNENVIINYLDNKINSDYLDFSINRNSLIVSRNVIYTNTENILEADVIEMDIETKDTKIFMFDNKKKVNIKSKN